MPWVWLCLSVSHYVWLLLLRHDVSLTLSHCVWLSLCVSLCLIVVVAKTCRLTLSDVVALARAAMHKTSSGSSEETSVASYYQSRQQAPLEQDETAAQTPKGKWCAQIRPRCHTWPQLGSDPESANQLLRHILLLFHKSVILNHYHLFTYDIFLWRTRFHDE